MDLIDPETITERHERMKVNSLHAADIFEEYTKKYPRKLIATCDGIVYGPADTIKDMYKLLEREGADIDTAYLEYLNPDRLDPNIHFHP